MKLTAMKSSGRLQLQEYECPVCKDQLSLTREADAP